MDRQFVMSNYETQKKNHFSPGSTGPFVTHVFDTRENHNLGRYHITEFGLKLYEADFTSITGIYPAGPSKYAVKFSHYQNANQFVDNGLSAIKPEWCAFIPDSSLFSIGIVYRISPRISKDKILKGLDPEAKKVDSKVERIHGKDRTDEGVIDKALEKIKIYAKDYLPRSIRLFNSIYREVGHFVPAILRCYQCQRFGHGASSCRSEMRCTNCGAGHADWNCTSTTSCANCKAYHPASDKKFSFFRFNSEVILAMVQRKVCRSEAMNIVQKNYRINYEENTGRKFEEAASNPFNPYMSKKDPFEQRKLSFPVIEEEENPVSQVREILDPEKLQYYDHEIIQNIGNNVEVPCENVESDENAIFSPETDPDTPMNSPSQSPKNTSATHTHSPPPMEPNDDTTQCPSLEQLKKAALGFQ
ncbi:hypothetical protein QAD02_011546 [Eretmocerus hayati]|uniref:Uncharacterized protein n=1 Tax=Eretmocerus hayati TaxID=131215 RepID=A0ACC2NWR0_9HYME|nr:hypothetical protein QAD02_011546 [Eretmocerus hayati]